MSDKILTVEEIGGEAVLRRKNLSDVLGGAALIGGNGAISPPIRVETAKAFGGSADEAVLAGLFWNATGDLSRADDTSEASLFAGFEAPAVEADGGSEASAHADLEASRFVLKRREAGAGGGADSWAEVFRVDATGVYFAGRRLCFEGCCEGAGEVSGNEGESSVIGEAIIGSMAIGG